MRATVMFGAGDVRIENVPDARLIEPTDALVAVAHACICGSDLWPYRTLEHTDVGRRMGHEAIGVVEAVGADVRTMKVGDIVVIPYLLVSTLPDRVFCHLVSSPLTVSSGTRRAAGRTSGASSGEDMTLELRKAIRAYIEGSNAHDADACAACFADDAVVRDETRLLLGSSRPQRRRASSLGWRNRRGPTKPRRARASWSRSEEFPWAGRAGPKKSQSWLPSSLETVPPQSTEASMQSTVARCRQSDRDGVERRAWFAASSSSFRATESPRSRIKRAAYGHALAPATMRAVRSTELASGLTHRRTALRRQEPVTLSARAERVHGRSWRDPVA
jgi:hypothetical protein